MKLPTKYLAIFLLAILSATAARGATAGDLDTSFNPGTGANSSVYATAVQTDGKIIIAGDFTSYKGVTRNRVARLNSNGSLDTTFDVGSGADADVRTIVIQSNGKIVVGGDFTNFGGYFRNHIARLNTNGSLDLTFDPSQAFNQSGGANARIRSMVVRVDDKIVIGGDFTVYRTVSRNGIARLNSDGTLDTTFNPGTGVAGLNSFVYGVVIAPDGKVVIGGSFSSVNGFPRASVARLNTNGSLDASFVTTGQAGEVYAVEVQADGKVLVGGDGLVLAPGGSASIVQLLRLKTNGSRDTSFSATTGLVYAIQILPNGRILFGASGTGLRFGRLNSDGSSDDTFKIDAKPNERVSSISVDHNGNIIIGGDFNAYGTVSRPRVARIFGVTTPTLRNIATRVGVGTGERVAIAGFIIKGNLTKQVLIRGIGPSLSALGVPGALQDPVIKLYNSSATLLSSNNNWKDTQQTAIAQTHIPPSDDRESALLITLGPGSYTVALEGTKGTTGNGLIELYDLTGGTATRLANISTRAFVSTGDNVMIGGFILGGDNARIVVRAIGPSLGAAGVSSALADPRVALYDANGGLIGFNLDWHDGQGSEIAATGLQPSDNREAALIVTLQAGNYTAVMEGESETTGVGLVEVYLVQ